MCWGNIMFEFQKQDCDLTLQEGLNIYYDAFDDKDSILKGDTLTDFIFGHDCTHVIFGLGLSVREESILDTYTIFGCKDSVKVLILGVGQIFKSNELMNLYKRLISEHGVKGLINIVISARKAKSIAKMNTKKMKKKWIYLNPGNYLSHKISDIRNEFGISVLSQEEINL